MKLNLFIDNPDAARQGYKNIDPVAPIGHADILRENLAELASVDDAECSEIVALDVLEYFPPADTDKILTTWIRKLGHGGMLTVGFTDLYQLVKHTYNRTLNISEVNLYLHGNQKSPWNLKRNTFSTDLISEVLQGKGLKILSKRIDGVTTIIKAVRP